MIDYGIKYDEVIVKSNDYTIEGGYEAAKDLLKNYNITAIFAQDDLMACGVYRAAKELCCRYQMTYQWWDLMI